MSYTQQQLFDKLRALKPMLYEQYGIKRIGVFGSYATGTQTENSDVDLIVELTRPLGWSYFGIGRTLEEQLSMKVDVATIDAVKPRIKDRVQQQLIYLD